MSNLLTQPIGIKPSVAAPRPRGGGDVLALGFGTTVAMWLVGYLFRAFTDRVPPWAVLTVLVACLLAGGWVMGCKSTGGMWRGALVGLLAGLLNLLVLGGILADSRQPDLRQAAWLWAPAFVGVCALLTLAGAMIGRLSAPRRVPWPDAESSGAERPTRALTCKLAPG